MSRNPDIIKTRSTSELFGSGVQRVRKRKKLSQDDLATRSFTSQSEISMVERGLSDPKLTTAYRIAVALSTTINNLIKQGGDRAT